jgi:hypothetical protein
MLSMGYVSLSAMDQASVCTERDEGCQIDLRGGAQVPAAGQERGRPDRSSRPKRPSQVMTVGMRPAGKRPHPHAGAGKTDTARMQPAPAHLSGTWGKS